MMNSQTQLMEYISLGQVEAVQKLLNQNNCNVNQQDEFGDSAILLAACRNDLAMLKILIAAGATVNTQDHFGNSPLSWAEKHHNHEMINLVKTYSKAPKKA